MVIGRNEPPIKAVEAIARCVFLTAREQLQFANEWTVEPRGYRLRQGQSGVYVIRHPDPLIQKILEQLRESESQQAVDRLRLVHATAPKPVYLLSNIPLDIDVDELVTWEEMIDGSRLERAWNVLPGVMPLAPAWLATQFPKFWKTADAAKADVARASKECRIANGTYIRNTTLFKHQYRAAPVPGGRRQRAWSVCLSRDADPVATRAALEGLLGYAVEFRAPKTAPVPPGLPTDERWNGERLCARLCQLDPGSVWSFLYELDWTETEIKFNPEAGAEELKQLWSDLRSRA